MPEQTKVDIRRWNKKVDKLLREYAPVVKKIVRYGNSKVSKSIDKNLRGGSYYPGKLPVRLITGTLRRAYKARKLTPYLYAHYMDKSIANYAGFVHYGTKYLKPRPYFRNAFDSNKSVIMNYWRYQFILEMRKTGRA